ncbi:MAG: hypothetical protein ABMA64_28745 [Myxococcota bacterium]
MAVELSLVSKFIDASPERVAEVVEAILGRGLDRPIVLDVRGDDENWLCVNTTHACVQLLKYTVPASKLGPAEHRVNISVVDRVPLAVVLLAAAAIVLGERSGASITDEARLFGSLQYTAVELRSVLRASSPWTSADEAASALCSRFGLAGVLRSP